jgi:hypothetical protein
MKQFRHVLFLVMLLLLIGLACSLSAGGTPSPLVTQETLQPITTPALTEIVMTQVPTPTKIPAFFTEEFDAGYPADHWQRFNVGPGNMSDLVIRQEAGRLLFDLLAEDIYVYYMYTPYTYTNISIKLKAENLGRNNNNISLVCRMNKDATQWYEFSVTSGGLWTLFAMDDHVYHIIRGGGTNFLKQGQETNEYQMVCIDNEIRLLINGSQIETVTDTKYGFMEGFVGFNISSLKDYSVLPITVSVETFSIERP